MFDRPLKKSTMMIMPWHYLEFPTTAFWSKIFCEVSPVFKIKSRNKRKTCRLIKNALESNMLEVNEEKAILLSGLMSHDKDFRLTE